MSLHPIGIPAPSTVQPTAPHNDEATRLRGEVASLRRDLTGLKHELDARRTDQLLEANEQLVLTSLQSQYSAEAAVRRLNEATRIAQLDQLTKLPGRALMLDRLTQAIAVSQRRGTRLAVLFLDLDHFKDINDTLGHAGGDTLLKLVSDRLVSAIRDCDTVSRHSGDEFVVLLPDVAHSADVAAVARKMLAAVAAPCTVAGVTLETSASAGIAIYPDDGNDAATLIRQADAAMYRAKRQQRGSFEFRSGGGADVLAPLATRPRRRLAESMRRAQVRDLREANQNLVLASVAKQGLEGEQEAAHRRQINFLTTVAHELRNPINPIRLAAELLGRPVIDNELLTRLKDVIVRQAEHMTRLVDDLLDGARISTGKFRVERGPIDLDNVLRQAVETCGPAIEAKRQTLTLAWPSRALPMHGDAARLTQVFGNLLENASKYTPEGGRLSLSAEVNGAAVVVNVSDDGIGIAPDVLPHIFDLYVQAAGAGGGASRSRGLGIGLAIVRELVEAHGGSVFARSAGADLGCEVTVCLPMSDAANVVEPTD